MVINASLPTSAAATNGSKNTASAGNSLASQIKDVMAKIVEVTQKLKDGINMSEDQRKSIQTQLTMLQQQLAELLRRQAQQEEAESSNMVDKTDKNKVKESNIDIYI
ncbi:FlxA-like family protein [Yersinia alsatica]|uniref:FlxA-like family protein n=1 Tax=Yersinia alsatica TaxID=2890317 RepID=UPI0005E17FE5|nr:FlxA-like family protein [Yersinia alsatica]CFQ56225.1 Uncharacterised protein [Yersinia frederiksenii]CND10563.1 Uncharacterised protein [Yersinia frederiksenii]CNI48542.1 Uncharacterised protein [Yersinia frederiksenii]